MSEALEEARAYTAVNEVMVFKGGRGMNVSKKDLPVFRAKGWELKEELEEANMKRLLQALQDKLSKEGGAAGFDDLKKTAKTMGVNLTPDMLKNMPGIKQHRDGDYILEGGPGSGPQKGKMKPGAGTRQGSAKDGGQTDKEADDYDSQIAGEAVGMTGGSRTLDYFVKYRMGPGDRFITNGPFTLRDAVKFKREVERKGGQAQVTQDPFEEREVDNMTEEQLDEALDVKWDSNKQGWFDRQGRRRYLGVMATNKLMAKALDKAKKTGDFINPYKLKHGQTPEQVEEAFTRKDFQELETTNDHTEAAEKLINMFGTKEEKFAMAAIKARHNMTGYINGKDYSKRQMMVNKYYSRLK